MHVKRFEAASLSEALAQVKAELGPDALILSTRTLRRGRERFGLFSRETVEVQAARERAGEAFSESVPTEEAAVAAAPRAPWSGGTAFEAEVRAELRALRAAVAELSRPKVDRARLEDDATGFLAARGLDAEVAWRVVSDWRDVAGQGAEVSFRSLGDFLADRIEARCTPPRPGERPRARVIVGAPGVGKTTTLAKLAARNEEGERDVVLACFDHYRIGGADQLQRYAALLESPFEEVSDARAIGELAGRHRGRELLIDTAGRSAGDEDRLASLAPLRAALGDRAEFELVIDATARSAVQRSQLRRFASLEPERVILTRTDECESLAPLANVLLDPACPPVCWRGSGQRVPEDLELVDSQAIVRDLLEAA